MGVGRGVRGQREAAGGRPERATIERAVRAQHFRAERRHDRVAVGRQRAVGIQRDGDVANGAVLEVEQPDRDGALVDELKGDAAATVDGAPAPNSLAR